MEQDWIKVFSEQLTRFLRAQAPNLGLRPRDTDPSSNPVRLLDYACASGGASWVSILYSCVLHIPPPATIPSDKTMHNHRHSAPSSTRSSASTSHRPSYSATTTARRGWGILPSKSTPSRAIWLQMESWLLKGGLMWLLYPWRFITLMIRGGCWSCLRRG